MDITKGRRSLHKYFRRAKKVFIMAHKDLDLDALGSSVGIYRILERQKKKCFLVIDDKTHELGVSKVLRELEGCVTIVKGEEVEKELYYRNNKNLLIILDTNKKELVQNEKILSLFQNKVIIDHHETGSSTIKDTFEIIDTNASSTCEMITKLIEIYDIELGSYFSTLLLSGIVLDTNNFTLKTNEQTYYSAYYLSRLGASAKKVQYLLKQDLKEYKERQTMFANIEIIDNRIAFTKATPYATYKREDLAKVADTLLFFNDIEASFVIGKLSKDEIGISARSLGNYDISNILKHFGGGGDSYNGAAKISESQISKVEAELRKLIKKEGEE